jgi:hypothetical protein
VLPVDRDPGETIKGARMSDETEQTSEAQPTPPLTADDLKAVDLESPLSGIEHADCFALFEAFGRASHNSYVAGDERAARVYGLLRDLCGLHRRKDPAGPYVPMLVTTAGRSAIPQDFRGQICSALKANLISIKHPGLRARIADIIWLNNRRDSEVAEMAVEAYCETVESLLVGKLHDRFKMPGLGQASLERVELVERAFQISATIRKRGQLPHRLTNLAVHLREIARHGATCVPYKRLAALHLQHGLAEPVDVAKEAEAVGNAATAKEDAVVIAIKPVFELAAGAYRAANDKDSERRCLLLSVDQTLTMRSKVAGASAQAHWVRTAIAELRQIQGTNELREKLRREMRQLQKSSVDEAAFFEIPLDLEEMCSGTVKVFGPLTLPDALLQFAFLANERSVDELKREALENLKHAPLSGMMPSVHYDNEGKIVAESEGAPTTGEPDEEWFKKAISRNLGIHRQVVVGGAIDPARQTISANHSISESHFLPITVHSAFVPASHRHTFALGFARLMQGDFISAANLLVPQLENSIRYVLHSQAADCSKIMSNMLQEDRSLSALLEQLRPDMDRIFTPAITYELELLFTYPGGPTLRHTFAHGKAGDGASMSPDVIYACWLIYRLTCLPLMPYWSKYIAPLIEAETF